MPIVTDGLIGYWHYQQGVSGSTWENISPETIGQNNMQLNGATLQSDGVYFDGIDDYGQFAQIIMPARTTEIVFEFSQYHPQQNYITHAISYTGMFGGFIIGAENQAPAVANFIPELNKQYNIVMTVDEFYNTSFYLNGELLATSHMGEEAAGRENMLKIDSLMGTTSSYGSYGSMYTNGFLKVIRVYDKVLTPQEIQQNYVVGMSIGLDLDQEQEPQEPQEPDESLLPEGVVARLQDGTLRIKETFTEGETLSLQADGSLRVYEVVEGESPRISSYGTLHLQEIIERG